MRPTGEGISPTMTKLDAWLDQHHAAFTAIRRDIHEHPELGLEEVRTAKLVADKLREWGVEVTENVGKTGVVGVIRGNKPGREPCEQSVP